MSDIESIQVNQYLQKHIKNYTSYQNLVNEIISKGGGKQRNGKHILSVLRELTIYNAPNQAFDPALADCLLSMLNDASTNDIDRKIIRSSYFLLTELVLNAPRDAKLEEIAQVLINRALADVKYATDSRLCNAWHVVSRVAQAFQQVDLFRDSLFTLFKNLRYPEKEKRLLLGKKKATQDYENQLHLWTALFSSLRRLHLVPPVDSIPIIFIGCKSSHTQLSRHAFYLLKHAIEKHPAAVCPMFQAALKDSNVLSRASADVHSCIYLMEACKSFIISLEKQQSYSHDPIVDTLNYLFMLLADTCVKIRMECIRILTEIPPGGMFTQALVSMGIDSPQFVSRMISAVQPSLRDLYVPLSDEQGAAARRESAAVVGGPKHVLQPIGFGNVSIGPLCRACIRLGRYVIVHLDALLANTNTPEQGSSGAALLNDVFKPLAKELFRLMTEFRVSSVFLSHAYCDTLKALLWLLPPDPTEDNKQAVDMYNWFQNQAISALPTLQEGLTEAVMRHIFGRIEESPGSPDLLLRMALKCAERAVTCFNNSSGQAVGMLIQVWEQFAARKERKSIQATFLRSLLSAVDGSLWQPDAGGGAPSTAHYREEAGRELECSPEQGLVGLKLFALWALGEYASLWDNLAPGANDQAHDLTLQGVMFSYPSPLDPGHDPVPPLLLVAVTLFQGLQTEEPSLRAACVESLFKLAAHCPARCPVREAIEDELFSIAADAFSVSPRLASAADDPRSHPVLLASMQLTTAPQSAGNSGSGSGSGSGSACHSGARWLGMSPNSQSSAQSREALLCSVALESMRGFGSDSFPRRKHVAADSHSTTAGADLFGEVDLLGDVFSSPPVTTSHTSASSAGSLLWGGEDPPSGQGELLVREEAALEDLLVQLNLANFYN